MKKLTAALTATSLLIMANGALAGKQSGLYIGGSLANSSYDVIQDGGDLSDDDTSYKIFGGYTFGLVPFFDLAAELSYIDLGSIDIDNKDYGSSAIAGFGLAAFNFGPFGVFGKYGVAQFDGDISDDLDDAYGVGLRLQLGSIAIRTEYELFELNDGVDVDYTSIGASWTF